MQYTEIVNFLGTVFQQYRFWAIPLLLLALVVWVGREFWNRNKEKFFEWVENRSLPTISRWVRNISFHRRYNKIIRDYSDPDLSRFGTLTPFGFRSLKLSKTFVQLYVSPPDKGAQKRLIWHELRGTRRGVLLLRGVSGTGKTTLLRHISWTLASNSSSGPLHRYRRYGCRAYVPVFLDLNEVANYLSHADSAVFSLSEMAQKIFSEEHPKVIMPQGWLEEKLSRGKCLVLLDGLDAVIDQQQREYIIRWVAQQVKTYADCTFLVTMRPNSAEEEALCASHILDVRPFDSKQVQAHVKRLFLELESRRSVKKNGMVRQRARQAANDLLQQLRDLPQLFQNNPLLLTFIILIYQQPSSGQTLPTTRIGIYERICQQLLERHPQQGGVPKPITDKGRRALEYLAEYMMRHSLFTISSDKAISLLSRSMTGIPVEDIWKYVQHCGGFLQTSKTKEWYFDNQTFKEYLAAAYWLKIKKAPDWEKLVGNQSWHETLKFYSDQSRDVTPIVQACLVVKSSVALRIGAACVETAQRKTLPMIEQQLLDVIRDEASLEASDPALRRCSNTRRLRNRLVLLQRRASDWRAIDSEYITCAEYQLFVDDMREQSKYCQPDHWETYSFPLGDALQPVAGVRAEDAEEFCEWVTKGSRRNNMTTFAPHAVHRSELRTGLQKLR